MKPEAILAAIEELIGQIETTEKPAHEIINQYTRSRRYIGSKDRRQLTDGVWSYVRHRRRLQYLAPKATLTEKLALIQAGKADFIPDAPLAVNMEVPDWIIPLIPNATAELPALLQEPSVILRANGDRTHIRQLLAAEGVGTTPTALSPYGLILSKRCNIQSTACYRQGLVEVQDEGSQLVALATAVQPGERILDYCAGAGGKSLILAQMIQNKGMIVAHDISKQSLTELKKRATRAGATCIQIQQPVTDSDFDVVVVDVPCSGTGTWRRFPDMRWKLTPKQVAQLVQKQADIFQKALAYVRVGGRIAYMTCSLLKSENEEQVQRFLTTYPNLSLKHQQRVSPALTQTDGLFVAVFEKTNR